MRLLSTTSAVLLIAIGPTLATLADRGVYVRIMMLDEEPEPG